MKTANGYAGGDGKYKNAGTGASLYGRGKNGVTSVPWQCLKGNPKGRSGGSSGSNGTKFGKGGTGGQGGDIGSSWKGRSGKSGNKGAVIIESLSKDEFESLL